MDQPEPPSPPLHPRRPPEPSGQPSKPSQQYSLGIALLFLVVALWVGSSFLMSSMFRHQSWNQPWLVTYICTSSFSFYLIRPAIKHFQQPRSPKPEIRDRSAGLPNSKNLVEPDHGSRGSYASLSTRDANDRAEPSPRSRSVTRAFSQIERPLRTDETAKLALNFVVLWFAANWSVNAALGYTSVSSTTILSSMSGFFTLVLGSALGVEKFNLGRLIAVAASISGVVLVSKSDHESMDLETGQHERPLLGDMLALGSAALYAVYVILMKVKVRDESRVDMQLFFGFVGIMNLLLFWPVGVFLHYAEVETFRLPPNRKMWLLVIINAMSTFTSDYLYMLAMLKTSPLVVTLGLSLTLPVAVVGDMVKGEGIHPISLLGAALVLCSFGILSYVDQDDHP